MKITILHIADLHCNAEDELYLKTVSSGLCKDLKALAEKGIKPDIACITGDIINKGENSALEFALAETYFIRPLVDILGISRNRFFYTPGNHDVDRTQASKAFEMGLEQTLTDQREFRAFYQAAIKGSPDIEMLKKKLKHYYDFISLKGRDNLKDTSLFCDVFELTVSGMKIGIASINSAWRSSQYGTDVKRLIIGDHVILEATSKISSCDLRICLCHHPLEMLTEWDTKPVRQAIAKHFNVLLNGHVHDSDAMSTRQILGNLFVSTAGCLKPNEQFSSYSIIVIDLAADKIICHLRKWYKEREEFDQETSKATNGTLEFLGIKMGSPKLVSALNVAVVRGRLQTQRQETDLVCPIEGIDEVELDDVFVEPLLTNKSGYDKDTDDRKTFCLDDLLKLNDNLLIAGRPEFGKTTIIKYARDYILKHDKYFDFKIPVLFHFKEVSKSGVKSILRHLAKVLGQTEEQATEFATLGQLTLLIDDFNDRQDGDHEKRVSILRELYLRFPKCRYIFTTTEHWAPQLQFELLAIASDFKAEVAYIGSLNTARIRQLLNKWKQKQDFNVDVMLQQILYYFQHCQIPVTPLAVVLFLGVLFNRKKERNIKNEAYLIENYLETILEKLNQNHSESEPDFRDKEDFLATFAWELVLHGKTSMELMDFEKYKIDFFEKRDEDLPRFSYFDTFFSKGILSGDDGRICFKRRFWLNFFIAKALETSKEHQKSFLLRADVLKYSKALSYKAGLSRKDVELLEWVDERALKEASPLINRYSKYELKDTINSVPITDLSDSIVKELKEKNDDDKVDVRRDEIFLRYDEDKGNAEDSQYEQFDDLLTLQSDIIRNTTQISVAEKRKYIDNNLSCYIAMMWGGLEMFREVLQKTDENELFNMFFKGKKDASMQHKLQVVIEHAQRVVHFVVPLSVLVYMNEHLGNPKLVKSFRVLAETTSSPTKRLFYHLLLFAQSPKDGIKLLKSKITADSTVTEDYILCGFLRWYCYQTKVDEYILDKIVAIFQEIRRKYAKKATKDIPFLKDTFRTDIRKDLQSKHIVLS